MKRALPLVVALLGAGYLLSKTRGPSLSEDGLAIHEFGKIPVIDNGRIKPLDSIARTQLRVVSDTETFKDDQGRSAPAIRWLLDVMVDTLDSKETARSHKVFRIYHPQVRHALGLEGEREGYRFSIREFGDRLPNLGEQIRQAVDKQHAEKPLDEQDRELLKFQRRLTAFQAVSRFQLPHLVPPSNGQTEWRTLPDAMQPTTSRDENAMSFVRILEAYAKGDAAAFNGETAAYLARVSGAFPVESGKSGLEAAFNRMEPFNTCGALYLIAFVLSCGALLGWSRPLNRSAFSLIAVVWVAHTLALATRIYLSGRAPVTNLYSSAIFIGWGGVLFGLAFELIFKVGIGNMVAAKSGFLTLLVAYVLAADGDTMEVLQAVLDTNFWLWTHVTCITLGYAASYVAGLIGLIYLLMGLFTRGLTAEMRTILARMTYGTVCFAMFFSFVGTVLGGLWADDSWGRFWGWDPKENGALMIVLWNALILHARWGGLVRERGLALLTVFGNVVVSWSWFGVNELSVGLHSYGFTEGRAKWLAIFMLSQVAAVLAGLLPRSFWKSPDAVREKAPAPPPKAS
jgi:ABC-type transport system involved in cytochrome c biogenesis permease subunit